MKCQHQIEIIYIPNLFDITICSKHLSMQAKWGLDILLTACLEHECHTNIHGFTCYSTNQCSALVNSAYSVISWTFYALKSSLSASRRYGWWYV